MQFNDERKRKATSEVNGTMVQSTGLNQRGVVVSCLLNQPNSTYGNFKPVWRFGESAHRNVMHFRIVKTNVMNVIFRNTLSIMFINIE